jgi:hypothetical protein
MGSKGEFAVSSAIQAQRELVIGPAVDKIEHDPR